MDEEQSKALTSINDQLLDTERELAGLMKAMTGIRDEMVKNLAKLSEVERKSEVEKHLAREHQKLTETSDPEIQQEIRDRIKNLEPELLDIKIDRESRLEALSANRSALRSQISRIRETFRRIHKDTTLAERIRTLFREQGITIVSILTPLVNLVGKAAAALSHCSIASSGKTATWLAENLVAMAIAVGTLHLVAAWDWVPFPRPLLPHNQSAN